MFKIYFLTIMMICCSSVLNASPEQIKDSDISVEETAGFVSGAIIGGLAGGPPGVILGVGLGVALGDKWISNKKALEAMKVALQSSNLELTSTRSQLDSLNKKYKSIDSKSSSRQISYRDNPKRTENSDPDAHCCEAKVSIHFKTGDSEIEEHYKEGLKLIASQARTIENSKIEIFGYSDRNGDSANNLELSKRRSHSVKRFLTQNGIDHASVTTVAYGETRPLKSRPSYESDFFDRRVTVHIRADESLITNQLVKETN